MATTVHSAQVTGLDARPIAVEVDLTPGLHIFTIVGLADKEVQESRERISAAIKNLGAIPPHQKSQRVIVNLAPADLKKEGPAFDVPIAVGYLLASRQINFRPEGILLAGELGLAGEIRTITGALPMAMTARAAGFHTLIVPTGNGSEAALIEGLSVIEVQNLKELVDHLAGVTPRTPLPYKPFEPNNRGETATDFKDIRGQEQAKRALEIAAAGGHNVLMTGPPGTGKTILARAITSILPPLLFDEALEVTRIYSVAGLLAGGGESFLSHRPFRSPHHTASHTAIIGGGTSPRPGEATLAHRGVLFLDEFPEFDRRVVEALRQPLEEHAITVSRMQGTATFPAQFMLVAAMNPCPCGNFGNPRIECTCTPGAIMRYKKKISGPILDRIDLHVDVLPIAYEKFEGPDGEPSAAAAERILRARATQIKRFAKTPLRTNAEMGLREIKQFLTIHESLKPLIALAHERHKLSARGYHRVLKLARTIADLAGTDDIKENHLLEALRYRPKIEA